MLLICIFIITSTLISGISVTSHSCWENISNLHCYFALKWEVIYVTVSPIIIINPSAPPSLGITPMGIMQRGRSAFTTSVLRSVVPCPAGHCSPENPSVLVGHLLKLLWSNWSKRKQTVRDRNGEKEGGRKVISVSCSTDLCRQSTFSA